jgi:tetratricopeptide (TPR) repeat protein
MGPVLSVFEKYNNLYGQMAATHTYGFIYGKMKEWSKAEEFMLKARRIAQKAGFVPAESKIVIDMGRMFKWRGDPDKAMLYFKEAKVLLEKSGAKRELERLAQEMKEAT